MDTLSHLTALMQQEWENAGRPENILAAYSGGADSTALLVILHALSCRVKGQIRLLAVHVDHGIREESCLDAKHAEKFCKEKNIDFRCVSLNLTNTSEDAARQARYQALCTIGEKENFFTIALAHHLQDQCETMLLRMMRGTGNGLSGMRKISSLKDEKISSSSFTLWRPLLDTDFKMLRKMLREEKISWCEDRTNQSDLYLRNHLRLNVIPLISSRSPNFEKHMAQTARILQDEDDFLEEKTSFWLSRYARAALPCPFLDADALEKEHPALQKRIVRSFFRQCGLEESLSYRDTISLLEMKEGDCINLPLGWHALKAHSTLHALFPKPPPFEMGTLLSSPFFGEKGDGRKHQSFPQKNLKNTCLRTRKEGDFIQPFGMKGKKSLQDYLVDKKIPAPFRDYLPLLCRGNEVLWVIGVGAGEKARANKEDSVLYLTYQGNFPMELHEEFTKETDHHGTNRQNV